MRAFVVAIFALVGCYEAPAHDEACSILCEDRCPDDMACVNGYCVGDGDTCEPQFVRVHAGNGFACALDEAQRRWCWGANDHHQLDASDQTQIVYATLTDDTRWDSLASGGDHACGIRNGELYCWGGNDHQQVTAAVIGDVDEPVRIASPSGLPWQSVATGFNSTCGISDRLYCWGANESGQLGTGTTNDVGIPAPVMSEVSDWTSVSLGGNHTCAISRNGGLHCWGNNDYGAVGNSAALYGPPVLVPTAITLPGVTSVAVAAYSTCAVAEGQLYCWGYPYSSVLGDPALTNTCTGPRAAPALSSGLAGWTSVSASQFMSCGLRGDEVWCWGAAGGAGGLGKGVWGGNGWGRVTLGASDLSLGWNANVDEEGDTQDVDLACIITGGKVQCWGDNRFGQLAQGDATMHSTPREIAGNHRWATLLASDVHTCGITDAGELMCWGSMQSGQTIGTVSGTSALPCGAIPGVPCTLGEPTSVPFHPMADAVAVGDNHTCALLGTTITCWGGNGGYQLGVMGAQPLPVVVPGAWTQLFSTGSAGTCGVQNGATWCWGTVISPYQPVAADPRLDGMTGLFVNATVGDATYGGGQRTVGCFLDKSGVLNCFGDNSYGQFGTGAMPAASCGNAVCELGENASTCAGDCPGTQVCTTDSCTQQAYCYTTYASCGDGVCTRGYGETCSSCGRDCGVCPVESTNRPYLSFGIGMLSSTANVCGVRPDGHVECWARNANGQVGLLDTMTSRPIDPVYTPYELPGLSGCTAVGAGEATSCAICDGDIWCWGSNRRGTLGSGSLTAAPITQPRKVAVELESGDRFVQITSGTGYSCARSEQGRGFCWGFHRYGALGTGGTSANLPVDIKLARAQ